MNMRILLAAMLLIVAGTASAAEKKEHYEIRIYHVKTSDQVARVDAFLQHTYLPALHRIGIKQVGVFHHIDNDTAVDKRVFVFIPLKSLSQIEEVEDVVLTDPAIAADDYWNSPYNSPPFTRIETVVLKSFPLMTKYMAPALSGPKTERVYELRSYEGPTERLYRKKVEMFNQGGEIALFKRLGFNAVFYAEVISGAHMPNLMYMTSFNNRADRDAHWKTFGADPEWVKLKDMPQYLNTVSRNDTMLLNPTEFSEL
jgi:hypothetical protein